MSSLEFPDPEQDPVELLLDPIYELVTRKTVLLEAPSGTKHPITKGAQKITLEESLTPAYQRKLAHAAASSTICARLGVLSYGLLTIDLDVDDPSLAKAVYERLLSLNPRLRHTLTTRGRPTRCQIWFRVIGEFPHDKEKLIISLEDGTKIGELRNGEGNQWQSVLTGIHPETHRPYTFLIEEPAIEIHWFKLIWPPEWVLSWNKPKADQSRGGGTSDYEWTRKFKGCDLNRLNLAELLRAEGLKVTLIKEKSGKDEEEKYAVSCPWLGQHTMDGGEREAVIWQRIGNKWPTFQCSHTHCAGKGLKEVLEWVESREPGITQEFCSRTHVKDSSQPAAVGGVSVQDDRFFPSTEWQEAPDCAAVPPGGEYRVNIETNKSEARWDPPVPGPEKVFDRRTNQFQRAGPKTPGPSPDHFSNLKSEGSDPTDDTRGPEKGSPGYGGVRSPFVDLVTLADEPDQPELDLLGNGYLRRGGGMFIIGPTECGKSSLSVQLAVEWSCALKEAIIKSCGELRVMVIQAEDDRQDGREMARVCRKLNLSPEQIEQVRKNTRFVEWCPKGYKIVKNEKGELEAKDVESGREFTEFLDAEIELGGPVDIIIVNPLSAYMDEGVMSQKANRGFFYGSITPFLKRQNCAIVFVHHTPKFKDDAREQHYYVQLYAGAGDATITNWPRASFFVRPTKQEGLFQFVAGKRGRRIGWDDSVRFFKWAEGFILWQEVPQAEIATFTTSKANRGGVQSISAADLYKVMAKLPEWVVRADLIEALVFAGFKRRAAERTIHPVDGYQRANLLYRGENRKTEIKWKGFSGMP